MDLRIVHYVPAASARAKSTKRDNPASNVKPNSSRSFAINSATPPPFRQNPLPKSNLESGIGTDGSLQTCRDDGERSTSTRLDPYSSHDFTVLVNNAVRDARAGASRAASTFSFPQQPDAHIQQATGKSFVCKYPMAEEPNTTDDNVSKTSPQFQIIDNIISEASLPYEQAAGENRLPDLDKLAPSKSAMNHGDGNGDGTTPLGEPAARNLIVGEEVIDGVRHYAVVGNPNLMPEKNLAPASIRAWNAQQAEYPRNKEAPGS